MQSTIHITTDIDVDAHAPSSTYYTTGLNAGGVIGRLKISTSGFNKNFLSPSIFPARRRRASHDPKSSKAQKFLLDVNETLQILMEQEDTDGDFQITVNDLGPKSFLVGTADSGGYRKIDIRGTYMLSNLLQELAIAKDFGRKHIVLDESRLNENPVDRLSRMIRHNFWHALTRRMDADGMELICADTKNRSANHSPRIYVPHSENEVFDFYTDIALARPHLGLEVERLPESITPEYVKSINERPGILALAMRRQPNGQLTSVPFVVPGGRFNEMYGWDSYFEALGLLGDGHWTLARDMVDNFRYQIDHYGKILNANRSYYLSRSQPPFLTDMALQVYKHSARDEEQKQWLWDVLQAAIKEYNTVWMASPRLDPKTGLSRYRPDGLGIPPETEASHFDHVIEPFSRALGISKEDYMKGYNDGIIKEPILDEYFLHDRAVRESGHDTTYRFDGICANLATIDLNALLYKYESDLAHAMTHIFHKADEGKRWQACAELRKQRIDQYLWNEDAGLYFDYDTVKEEQTTYESVTAFWAMWAGCASDAQAQTMAKRSLHKFEALGGLVSGTEKSRGIISLDRPNRQWDFPFGWAPHQVMAWKGFQNYNMHDIAARLAYRWLYTITKSFVDFNGVVPEKYDVVSLTHKVQVEYGNVGTDFKLVPREGFGWMNASYQVGLTVINTQMRRALGACTSPDLFFDRTRVVQQSKAAARALTRNGNVTAAITHVEPKFIELTEPLQSGTCCLHSFTHITNSEVIESQT
ncbi:trehalase-domain-containing protein [Dichotomocladium elegans]|nr:trehalase-domain-containing protein [Dichotomocladium elegans]